MSQAFETLIQIYADGEGFFPPKPDGKEMGTARKLLTNFRRGFNTRQPLSAFEDTSVTGPSGAGDTLLKQLKDSKCIQVIVAKPFGPGFRALLQAQRRNGNLPAKITELMIHPQARGPSLGPYPFMEMPWLAVQENAKQSSPRKDVPTPSKSVQKKQPAQEQPTQEQPAQEQPTQQQSTQQQPAQEQPTQQQPTQNSPAQGLIPRNRSGQRVDPRVEGLEWLVRDARQQKICYEYHLHGKCTWVPAPCPRKHVRSSLSVQQLNALQVIAREQSCKNGNACKDWTCCFGHRCFFGEKCNRGKRCRFSQEMHFSDLKVVR